MNKLQISQAEHDVASLLHHASEFYRRGWMWGTAGNLSVKLSEKPLAIAITGSGASKGEMGPEDMAVKPAEARTHYKWLGDAHRKPSAETVIHDMIYEHIPEAGAIYHVHTVVSTALSLEAERLGSPSFIDVHGLEMLKGWEVPWHGDSIMASIPVIDNHERMGVLADGFWKLIKQGLNAPVIVIAGHGITVWGRTPEETRNRVEIAEFIFQTLWEQLRAGVEEKNFTLRGMPTRRTPRQAK